MENIERFLSPDRVPEPPQTSQEEQKVVFTAGEAGRFTLYLRGDVQISITPHIHEATESPVSASETSPSGFIPDSTTSPVTEAHSGPDVPSQTASKPEDSAEDENRKFELVGNPVRDPSYRVRRSGKRIADFVLATHPTAEETEY